MKPICQLLRSLLVGLLSSNAAFATDDGKLNPICTVHHSANVPMRKSPSSSTITGAVENNAAVTLLDEDAAQWAHIRKKVGTTGWIQRGFLDCPSWQMPEPLQGKWCPDRGGLDFFMNRQERNYSSCNESGQPELLVLSDEVQVDGSSCRPIQVTKFDVCLWGHGHTMGVDEDRLGYHVKLRCKGSYPTPAHDWIVGWIVGGEERLEVGPKRERIPCD